MSAESSTDLLASSSMNSLAPLRRILQASQLAAPKTKEGPMQQGLARFASFDENEVVVTNPLVDDLKTRTHRQVLA